MIYISRRQFLLQQKEKNTQYKDLGSFVSTQRRFYKEKRMRPDRVSSAQLFLASAMSCHLTMTMIFARSS